MHDINQTRRGGMRAIVWVKFLFLVCTYIGSRCQGRTCPLSSVYQTYGECLLEVLQIDGVLFGCFVVLCIEILCHLLGNA